MSDYDASIRINTKVDNNDLAQTQKEIDALNKKLDSLYAKGDKLQELGVNKQSKQWQSLKYDVAQTEMKLEDTKEKMEQLNEVNNTKLADGFDKAEKAGKKMLNTVDKGSKKTNGLLKTMSSRLKSIALSLLIFNWITKGFNAMVNAMKSGFQNLAKYSKDYNSSMSAMKSECAQLKNSLAAAFEPVANVIIPYITQLLSWVNTAAESISQFIAALSGKGTYTKAKKQVLDYAKSLDTANSSAKGALASFDSINVLTSDTASGGSSAGEVTGADAFEEADVSDSMQAAADAITPFKEAITEWIDSLDFEPLIDSFTRLKEACAPFGESILEGSLRFLNEVLLPISGWIIEDFLPAFFDTLAAALDAFNAIWVIAQPYLAWLWDNFLGPVLTWTGETLVSGLRLITEALTQFSDWASGNREDMDLMSTIVIGFFAAIITYFTVKKIVDVVTKIKTALNTFSISCTAVSTKTALASTALGVLATGILYLGANWGKLDGCQKVITILGALAAAAIACAVAVAIFHTAWSIGVAAAAIVGGLALLGLTTACLKSNGKSASYGDAKAFYGTVTGGMTVLPALATGGITNRPTTALIGEAGTEAVLPLENNTDWMDVLANRINGGNRSVYLQIDGKTFARLTGNYFNSESNRVGVNLKTT